VKHATRKFDDKEHRIARAVTQVATSRTTAPPDPRAITLEFTRNVYWVGQRHRVQLECNSYLRVFEGNGNQISILIDPGPLRDLDVINKNISSVIGSIDRLNYIYINHQDPDVAGNAAEIQRLNPAVLILCSEETWRVARHYGLDPRRYVSLESIPGQQIGLSTGHLIRFVPTPFCHARGAAMLYDPENGVLFSGDLFGGTTARDGYVFSDEDLGGIQLYHQIYMPSRRALQRAISAMGQLNPPVRMIAPQHGNIISREHITSVVDALTSLRVGMDLMEYNERNHDFIALANEAVRAVSNVAGRQAVRALISGMGKDQNLVSQFEIRAPDQIVAFKTDSVRAMEFLFSHAEQLVSAQEKEQLRTIFQSLRKRMQQLTD
jgi:glyoxylase-like metal-dependent hydrolase (beta-lactamase superfamily II)